MKGALALELALGLALEELALKELTARTLEELNELALALLQPRTRARQRPSSSQRASGARKRVASAGRRAGREPLIPLGAPPQQTMTQLLSLAAPVLRLQR